MACRDEAYANDFGPGRGRSWKLILVTKSSHKSGTKVIELDKPRFRKQRLKRRFGCFLQFLAAPINQKSAPSGGACKASSQQSACGMEALVCCISHHGRADRLEWLGGKGSMTKTQKGWLSLVRQEPLADDSCVFFNVFFLWKFCVFQLKLSVDLHFSRFWGTTRVFPGTCHVVLASLGCRVHCFRCKLWITMAGRLRWMSDKAYFLDSRCSCCSIHVFWLVLRYFLQIGITKIQILSPNKNHQKNQSQVQSFP